MPATHRNAVAAQGARVQRAGDGDRAQPTRCRRKSECGPERSLREGAGALDAGDAGELRREAGDQRRDEHGVDFTQQRRWRVALGARAAAREASDDRRGRQAPERR
jgi:hypothetical protein